MALLLAGCSGEPTEADLTKALQTEMDEVNSLTQTMLGETAASPMALHIVSVDKVGCSAGGEESSYLCDVEVVLDSSEAGRQTLRSQLRMLRKEQDWTVIKQL